MRSARKVIAEDYVIIEEGTYWDAHVRNSCKKYFREMQRLGKVRGDYEDSKWKTKDFLEFCGIDFSLDRKAYVSHGMKYIEVSFDAVVDAMKMYTIWYEGDYTFRGLQGKIRTLRKVLEQLGDKKLRIGFYHIAVIPDFLKFIGISEYKIKKIMGMIVVIPCQERAPRELKPILTYLAAADKIRSIMRNGTREKKIKWFPVDLVMELGFVIPLRPTGFSTIPFDCLQKDEDGYTITIRRTDLKKGKRTVSHDEGDYKLNVYRVPYTEIIQDIEWYLEETKGHERPFLLDYSENSVRDSMRKRFSLESINALLKEFVETQLNDTNDYRWAMGVCGIEKFEPFTAGDMRPLALINLYFSGAPLDICMELADHENMEITYHYIRNIKEVIEGSAFMKMQKRINDERREIVLEEQTELVEADNMAYGCNSQKILRMDPSDCDKRCLDSRDCILCRHYKATQQEKNEFIAMRKQELEKKIKEMRCYIREYHGDTFDKQVIQFQKACEAYADACGLKAQQEYERWKEMRGV